MRCSRRQRVLPRGGAGAVRNPVTAHHVPLAADRRQGGLSRDRRFPHQGQSAISLARAELGPGVVDARLLPQEQYLPGRAFAAVELRGRALEPVLPAAC